MTPAITALRSRDELEAVEHFALAEFADVPQVGEAERRAFETIAPQSKPSKWRCATISKTPKAIVKVHEVSLDGSAGASENVVVFAEKRSITSTETDVYKELSSFEFDHSPELYHFEEISNPSYGDRKHTIFFEFIVGRPIGHRFGEDAILLADAMASINDLETEPGPLRGFEFQEAVDKLAAAREFNQVFDIHSTSEWDQIDRRLDEIAPMISAIDAKVRPAHSDLHPRNFFVTERDGDLVVKIVDWENLAQRPVGTDLYQYLVRSLSNSNLEDFYATLANRYAEQVERFGVTRRDVDIAALCAALLRTAVNLVVRHKVPATLEMNRIVLNGVLDRLDKVADS